MRKVARKGIAAGGRLTFFWTLIDSNKAFMLCDFRRFFI